jgi:hypothetical protein
MQRVGGLSHYFRAKKVGCIKISSEELKTSSKIVVSRAYSWHLLIVLDVNVLFFGNYL